MQRWSSLPREDRAELFRRMLFNCGLEGRGARRSNLVSQAARFGLGVDEADAMISAMKSIIAANWEGEVRRHGGTDEDCRRIASAFLYPGFEYAGGEVEW